MENGKIQKFLWYIGLILIQNSNATFWVIFKHCEGFIKLARHLMENLNAQAVNGVIWPAAVVTPRDYIKILTWSSGGQNIVVSCQNGFNPWKSRRDWRGIGKSTCKKYGLHFKGLGHPTISELAKKSGLATGQGDPSRWSGANRPLKGRRRQVFWGLVFDVSFITFQVGALEACVLAKQGYEVHLYEYRKGM